MEVACTVQPLHRSYLHALLQDATGFSACLRDQAKSTLQHSHTLWKLQTLTRDLHDSDPSSVNCTEVRVLQHGHLHC